MNSRRGGRGSSRRRRRQSGRVLRQCRRSLVPLFPADSVALTNAGESGKTRRRTSTILHLLTANSERRRILHAQSRGRNIATNRRRRLSTRRRSRSGSRSRRRIRYARLERWQLPIRSHLWVLPRMRDRPCPLNHHLHPRFVFARKWEAARIAWEEVRDTDITELEDEHGESLETYNHGT